MRVILKLKRNAEVLDELDLQPSNLRQLVEVDYLGRKYKVVGQYTVIVQGEPVATVWVKPL